MTNPLRPILAPLLLSLLALPGCDEADPLDLDDTELRAVTTKVVYQTPSSQSFKIDILPPDGCAGGNDWPGGGGPPDFKSILRNAPSIFAAAYQGSYEAEVFCPAACDEAGMNWNGEVTAQAELNAAEAEWTKNDEGGFFAETLASGEVAMGCACEVS